MAERIPLSLCCLLCAGAFFLNHYLCRIRSTPVAFWTGSEDKRKSIVKDAAGSFCSPLSRFGLHNPFLFGIGRKTHDIFVDFLLILFFIPGFPLE